MAPPGPGEVPRPTLVTSDLDRAVRALLSSGLVAIPTETVYGLAAAVTDVDAVERVFAVKGRPRGHPLIVHLADAEQLDDWAAGPSEAARILAATTWPGPLTVIVPRSPHVPDEVTGGRATVGLRVPAHDATRELIRRAGTPVAAPSANRFGAVSPTTAAHVLADLGDRLDPRRDVILDGGPCPIGVESTIVDCVADPPQILRAGGVPREQVEQLVGGTADPTGPPRASGMLASHYAPRCRVVTAATHEEAEAVAATAGDATVLDLTDDLARYAQQLYAELRSADSRGLEVVVAVLPPPVGLGHAIRDRLAKAAAGRTTGDVDGDLAGP